MRKSSDNEIISNPYPNAEAEKEFQKMVFNPEVFTSAMTGDVMHYQTEHSLSPMEPVPTIEELNERKLLKFSLFYVILNFLNKIRFKHSLKVTFTNCFIIKKLRKKGLKET